MASYLTNETAMQNYHVPHMVVSFIKAATSDWITLDNYKGVLITSVHGFSVAANLRDHVPTYGVATINNGGAAYTATSTSIVIASGTVTRVPPFYVMTQAGEVLEVTSETDSTNAASTWTVRRGCLGTTASATGLAHTNVVHILNMIVCPANCLGNTVITGIPLPNEPEAAFFA
jgi:hypothetical protein